MGADEWLSVAAAAGHAIINAAASESGKDLWNSLRKTVGRLLSRGSSEHEAVVLAQLDETRSSIAHAGMADQTVQAALWQARFETLLGGLPDDQRVEAITAIRVLLAQVNNAARPQQVSTQHITASGHASAFGVQHGNLIVHHTNTPNADDHG